MDQSDTEMSENGRSADETTEVSQVKNEKADVRLEDLFSTEDEDDVAVPTATAEDAKDAEDSEDSEDAEDEDISESNSPRALPL